MKKIVLLSFFIAVIVTKTNAQFYAGAKCGLAISTFTEVYMPIPHIGYKAGIYSGYKVSNWELESGIYMKEAGIERSEGYLLATDGTSVDVQMHIPAVYIEMPLSLLYKIPVTKNFGFKLNGGIYAAYGSYGNGYYTYYIYDKGLNRNLGGISTFKNSHSDGNYLKPLDIKGANRLDYGLTLGVQIEAANINFGAYYDYGLANVYDVFQYHPDSKNIKNRVFWIGLGYNFFSKK